MFSIGERFGTFLIAAALLFAALRIHGSSGKHTKVTKPAGLVLAFLAGAATLVTFVGDWVSSKAGAAIGVAGLIVCVAVILVDWLFDKKPDKFAFWSAFALALFMVIGIAGIPSVTGQVGAGLTQVGNQVSNGTPAGTPAKPAGKK